MILVTKSSLTHLYQYTYTYWYKCVRLSRLLAFECTLNHCTFIHSLLGNVYGVGLANERLCVQLPAVLHSHNEFGQVVHTCVCVTSECNLLPTGGPSGN